MKFVALISGGKDSCFNIIHCLKQGHELVALANLYPINADENTPQNDEIDSWMYQTVGYHAVSKYGEALDVPLYRVGIKGNAKSRQMQYIETRDDETEDLKELLELVVKNHPEITAVSSGAILSNYQRIRVEHVCEKLQLTSLAYLWQRPQNELLDELISSGLDIRIIKTAGIGLNRTHLGKSLAELRPVLIRLNELYGLHLCGEGGEYETLVVDGPIFKKRLNITEMNIIDHSADDVSYLSLRVDLQDKCEPVVTDFSFISSPPLLDEKFLEIFENCGKSHENSGGSHDRFSGHTTRYGYDILALSNEQPTAKRAVNIEASEDSKVSLHDEIDDVFEQLTSTVDINSLAYVSLILRDMKDFVEINAAYKSYLENIRPPSARACIESNRIAGRLKLSAYTSNSNERSGLHVQSRSYWAPANIGPYSQQANSGVGYSFLAGQIGLIPSTMELAEDSLLQSVLSLQHLYRVTEATSGSSLSFLVSFVTSKQARDSAANVFNNMTFSKLPGLIIVEISNLPKNAAVEWTGIAIDEAYWENESYNDDEDSLVWPAEFVEQKSTSSLRIWSTAFGHYVTTVVLFASHSQLLEYFEQIKADNRRYSYFVIYGHEDPKVSYDAEYTPCNGMYDERQNSYEYGCIMLERGRLVKRMD